MKTTLRDVLKSETVVQIHMAFSERRKHLINGWLDAYTLGAGEWAVNVWVDSIQKLNDAEIVLCGDSF